MLLPCRLRIKLDGKHLLLGACCLLFIFASVQLVYYINCPVEAYFATPLTSDDAALLERTMRAFDEAMQSANLTYFVIGGTLVGTYRHHGRIPWDDDIDVILNASDKSLARKTLSGFDPHFRLYASDDDSDPYQWKYYPVDGHLVFARSCRTPYIDIFFFRDSDTHLLDTAPWFPNDRYLKRHVFPLVRRPYGDLMLPAPCNPLAIIEAGGINVSMCRSRSFNHLLEFPYLTSPAELPCESLATMYPFVRRTVLTGSSKKATMETLALGRLVLNEITLPSDC